jgi:hypothetical protein
MVQIGNFHIGYAETAQAPVLSAGEAHVLWDLLIARYNIIMTTQLYDNYAHDAEFKLILTTGLQDILERQVNKLENELNKYKLPTPQRPPKSVRFDAESGTVRDEFIFRQIFTGVQNFLDAHIRAIRITVFNDNLREMYMEFTKEEIAVFNNMCKYGKMKGWLQSPPMKTS